MASVTTKPSSRRVAVALAISMLPAPGLAAQTSTWEGVRDVPQGTRVRLALTDGAEVRGTVRQMADETLTLNIDWMKGGEGRLVPLGTGRVAGTEVTRTVSRGDVTTATIERLPQRYVAGDRPNAGSVRHVLAGLGVGKKIRVRTMSGRQVTGRIRSLADDGFIVDTGSPERVPYADVSMVESHHMSGVTKGLIIGGIAIGTLLLTYWIQLATCGCYG